MSTRQNTGFGGLAKVLLISAAAAGAGGCATSGAAFEREAMGATMAQGTAGMSGAFAAAAQTGDSSDSGAIRASDARVVGTHVNPMVPVRLTVEGGEIAVRFAHPRGEGAIAHLDSSSLGVVLPETAAPSERAATPSSGPVRASLQGGRFIVCWKSGDAELGYRVMAQAWTAGGSSLGPPVAVSPPDVDIVGAPQVTALEGGRAVATFATMTGDRAQLLAVSLQVL